MVDDFKAQADFYVVYIAEAHTTDGWQLDSNVSEGILIKQATAFEERAAAARACAQGLNLAIPILIDGMDNAACEAFSAWPERIYIIDPENSIHYRGGQGPYDMRPDEARASLVELLGAGTPP